MDKVRLGLIPTQSILNGPHDHKFSTIFIVTLISFYLF